MSRLGDIRVSSRSSFKSRTAEGKKDYSKDENLYVMFVDLKSNVKSILTHY